MEEMAKKDPEEVNQPASAVFGYCATVWLICLKCVGRRSPLKLSPLESLEGGSKNCTSQKLIYYLEA